MTQIITLPPNGRESAIKNLSEMLRFYSAGKPVNVKISIARPERTPPQCAYLWAVVYPLLADAKGYERDDVHEYLLGCHFGWREKRLPGGRVEQVPIRTTTTDEHGNRDVLEGRAFWDYVEFCQRVGARAGVFIPDPDPSYNLQRAAA
ncbi:hypothetical protein [Stenotrophomonas sp. 59]|uniref:hypothetical protein n=1 Tax=Stenotrophomonas sp. 59 TaxID=3051120 RepID=UPI00256EA521|nr:hypothetical protein [Stenotrophomonas sp. 59]